MATLEQFDSFIADQRLIAEAQGKRRSRTTCKIKRGRKDKKRISDSNLFPPSVDNPTGGSR